MSDFFASKCGTRAYQDSITPQTGSVIGNTSRGIFIKTENKRIVFLSSEPYINPLNINLEPYPEILRDVVLNESTTFGGGCVSFPSLEITIRVPLESVVQTPSPALGKKPKTDQFFFLDSVTRKLWNHSNPTEYISAIHYLMDNEVEGIKDESALSRFISIKNAAAKKNLSKLIPLLISFLGDGPGLTPSGDDLVIGFLLAMNRWNPRAWTPSLLEILNADLSTAAGKNTTTLSANMIELAASGDADERLIISLDSIFTGEKNPGETTEMLRSYGSSSGIDTFCGMVLTMK
jgi:hypothetical protein